MFLLRAAQSSFYTGRFSWGLSSLKCFLNRIPPCSQREGEYESTAHCQRIRCGFVNVVFLVLHIFQQILNSSLFTLQIQVKFNKQCKVMQNVGLSFQQNVACLEKNLLDYKQCDCVLYGNLFSCFGTTGFAQPFFVQSTSSTQTYCSAFITASICEPVVAQCVKYKQKR